MIYQHVIVMGIIVGIIAMSAHSEESSRDIAAIRGAAAVVLTDSTQYAKWRIQFASLSSSQLDALMGDDNDSVALMAAWERLVCRPTLAGLEDARGGYSVPSISAARYIAYCEGRLRLRLPGWFESTLREGTLDAGPPRISMPFEHHFLTLPFEHPLLKPREIDNGRLFTYESPDALRVDGTNIHLVGEGGSLSVPIGDMAFQGGGIAFDSERDQYWIADYSRALFPYPLTMRNNNASMNQWKTTVWASIVNVSRSGASRHRAMVRRHGKLVIVLGAGDEGAYIEGFNSETGAPTFRFITSILLHNR
jgi:hypothetical protein